MLLTDAAYGQDKSAQEYINNETRIVLGDTAFRFSIHHYSMGTWLMRSHIECIYGRET